jgi:hypothetical protein
LGEAALTTAGGVAVVLLLGFAGRLRARRMDPRRGLREAPHPPRPRMFMHAGRYTVAIGAAGSLATLADLGHSYWAMIAAAAPIAAADATRGLVRAVHPTVGFYGGGLLTACLLSQLQLAVLLAARWKRPSAPALRRNHRPHIGSFSRRSRTATRSAAPVTAPEAGLGRGSGLPRPGWMLVVLVCRTPHRCTCQATPQEAICPLQT